MLNGIGGKFEMEDINDMDNVQEDSKKICSSCGSENTETAKFCVECGQNIQINETENVCCNCGTISPAGIKFCPDCGQNLIDQTAQSSANNSSSNNLSDLIRSNRSVTERKGLFHKLASDASKAAVKAKSDIIKSVEDYTLAIEAEVNETQESYIVTIELPKIKKEDLDLAITPHNINLKAAFDHEVEIEQGTQITRKEIQRGNLNKDIHLNREIIPEKAEAEFNNDLLIIKLPKANIVQGYKLKF
jgi:HSP20 family protein